MLLDFRDAAFSAVQKIMAADANVLILYNDFGAQGLDRIKANYPHRAINVGIAEQNMISVAAGLALAGKKIVIYSIAAHVTTRCYEQVKLDICGMKLPVIILGMGSGLSYGVDGPTHQATADMAIMRTLPGITIYNPADAVCAQALIQLAYENRTPTYIRLDKDQHEAIYNGATQDFSEGLNLFDSNGSITIIATGMLLHRAIAAAKELANEKIMVNVVDFYRIKPYNGQILEKILKNSRQIVTLEEHSSIGGIGSIISEILATSDSKAPYLKLSLTDEMCFGSESRSWAHERYGMTLEQIIKSIKQMANLQSTGTLMKHSKNVSTLNENVNNLSLEDFANSFCTTVDEIPAECKRLIQDSDFRYRIIAGHERDKVILDVLKKIDTDKQVIGAPERRDIWQKGWSENLQDFIKSGNDLNTLIPKFVRCNQPIRLNGEYIMPINSCFELEYLKVLRRWLFKTYFQKVNSVYEFGCGTGHNLVELAQLYPEKTLYGLDFVPASVELVNRIGDAYNWNITGHLFDMVNPDEQVHIDKNSAILTFGALEQLAGKIESFLQFLIKQEVAICVSIEPTVELYDENCLFDYLAIKFHRKRGYSEFYLPRLKELEAQGKIELLKVIRPNFGSLYMEGYSCILWRPIKQGE